MARIQELRGFAPTELEAYLQAAQRVADYEDRRQSGAETRATAYIAAIATLIPLMTWALGNATPFCSGATECRIWAATFDVSIIYFAFAAYWSLQTLGVTTYHTIGVEDVVHMKEHGKPIAREMVVQTLQLARLNRDTINRKLGFIRTAQRCFFMGLLVLAGLLALDPWLRFGGTPAQVSANIPMVSGTLANQQGFAASPGGLSGPSATPPSSSASQPHPSASAKLPASGRTP